MCYTVIGETIIQIEAAGLASDDASDDDSILKKPETFTSGCDTFAISSAFADLVCSYSYVKR